MSKEDLHKTLRRLRTELEDLRPQDAALREQLDRLIEGVEKQIREPEDAEHKESLLEEFPEAIVRMEIDHPKLSAVLRQMVTALSSSGI